MKLKIVIILILFTRIGYAHANNSDNEIDVILEQMVKEIKSAHSYYSYQKELIYNELSLLNEKLSHNISIDVKLDMLIKRNQLEDKLRSLKMSESANINKIRYLKGLSIIKILYEKVLSLDHHFSAIVTLNEIGRMSNPVNYPEFMEVKDLISRKSKKKNDFKLSTILGQNIYTSSIDMIVGLINSDIGTKEKTEEIQKIECILDFTLRMNNDLKTIYFETSFLQKSNDKVMLDLERLFKDYTKPIKYYTPIKECRANDDWDVVRDHLSDFLAKLDENIAKKRNDKVMKMQIDLNFPIDRLLQFITEYNRFIDQGGKFYEKFKIILDSYENEEQCSSSLPQSYKKLKADIDVSIEKFNTAYKPVEINGSKLKEVLYGVNEFD